MNLVLLVTVSVALFSCECLCFNVRTTALLPHGFRACLASEKGIESFSFYAYTLARKTSRKEGRRRFEGNATSPTDGLWCYTNRDITLHINDEIVYWYRVVQYGQQHQTETTSKKLQAADFVDESGLYISTLRTTSVRSIPPEPTTESTRTLQSQEHLFATTADKVAQQEQIDYEETEYILVQPVTPKGVLRNHISPQQPPAKDELTPAEQQTLSEIFDNPPMVLNNENFNKVGHADTFDVNFKPQQHSEAEHHHSIVRIDKVEKNEEPEGQLIVSPPEKDVPLKPQDDKIVIKGTDEYDYTANGDSININIVINREARPCNISALFDIPKEDDMSRVPSPGEDMSSRKNKTKSCETLLSHEKKLSEAARSSYQDCAIKINVIENDLIDSKKEARVLSALLKETLEIINYLKVDSTNKLILKSSIRLIDYKQVLREVIHALLDVKPSQYNIVKSELEGDHIVKFEVGAYNEKLLLFLNGRIKLPGSNFQIIDYDAHTLYQRQVEKNKDNVN